MRVAVAVVGGYTLSAVISLWLAYFIGLESLEYRLFINMMFYLVYLLIVLVAFGFRSHVKTVGSILCANLLLWCTWLAIQ